MPRNVTVLRKDRIDLRNQAPPDGDYLWSFMRHWLSGLILKHDPLLATLLPATYRVGHPLPHFP